MAAHDEPSATTGIKKQIANIIYRVAVDAANSKPIDEVERAAQILALIEQQLLSTSTVKEVSKATNYASIPTRFVLAVAFNSIMDGEQES